MTGGGGGGGGGALAIVDGGGALAIVDGGGCSRLLTGGGWVRLAGKWYLKLVVLRLFAASARVHCFLISRATEWPEVHSVNRALKKLVPLK